MILLVLLGYESPSRNAPSPTALGVNLLVVDAMPEEATPAEKHGPWSGRNNSALVLIDSQEAPTCNIREMEVRQARTSRTMNPIGPKRKGRGNSDVFYRLLEAGRWHLQNRGCG